MSLVRKVAAVGAATLASRGLGFVRDVGIAAVLGAGALADAYFAALQVPNLFRRLLAEGAVNSAFVPQWLRVRDKDGAESARRFGGGALGIVSVALALAALATALLAHPLVHALAPGFDAGPQIAQAADYLRLSAPYVALAGAVAIAGAILNAEGRVAAAAFGLVLFNAVMVAAVAVVWLIGPASAPAAGAVLSGTIGVAGLAQLLFVGGALMRTPMRPRRVTVALSADVRQFLARAVPGLVAGGIPQLILMAGVMVASASPAAVSWLYYANRLYELPLGVVSIAIATVVVPRIAASVRTGTRAASAEAQSRGVEIALGLALPAAVALALLAEPIVGGLFERGAFDSEDTVMVAAALTAIAVGLPGHALEKSLAAVSFAHADTRTPMVAALCGLAAATAGALALVPAYGHVGVAAAIAAAGWVGAALLLVVLTRRGWLGLDADARRRLPRIMIATAAMALMLAGCRLSGLVPGSGSLSILRLALLVPIVAAGLAAYLGALHVLGVMRLADTLRALRSRPDQGEPP